MIYVYIYIYICLYMDYVGYATTIVGNPMAKNMETGTVGGFRCQDPPRTLSGKRGNARPPIVGP